MELQTFSELEIVFSNTDNRILRIDTIDNNYCKKQIARYDCIEPLYEKDYDYDKIKEFINYLFINCNAIIISDYKLGVITPKILQIIRDVQYTYNIPVFLDSKEYSEYTLLGNIHTIFPNESEILNFLKYNNIEDTYYGNLINNSIDILSKSTQIKEIILKRGIDGCYLITPNKDNFISYFDKLLKYSYEKYNVWHSNVECLLSNEYYGGDSIGAGDCVIATYVVAQLSGFSPVECLILADISGLINVTRYHTHSPTFHELVETFEKYKKVCIGRLESFCE
jgi:bifunctional ADP-heptose synthase (sugar kinase/adenylyltransferase)